MNAKEYLNQAYRLDQQITSKLEQIERLHSLTQKITVSYGGETVSHTRNVHSVEDTITKLIEAENALNKEIDRLVEVKMDIADTISMVRNESYRLILEKRYLCFTDWDRIAAEMHYSRRWTLTKHEYAVDVVGKLLEEKGVRG